MLRSSSLNREPKKRMIDLILSPRLKIIADSLKGFGTVADIGSDHAYLPIYLMKNRWISYAIATDVNKGPVEISKKRLKSHRIEGLVEVRQGNGLEAIAQGEADVIVIAGMGGLLIRDILERDLKVAESAELLVLQPMRDSDKVRKWLLENGFYITDEELVKEMDKIYEVIWAKPGGVAQTAEGLMLIGEKIIEKKHPLAAEYITKKARELEKVVAAMEGMDTEGCMERRAECKSLLDYYREVLQWVR